MANSIYLDDIISIESLGESETVDISVSGDNLFFANDILTHNSNSDVELTNTSECIFVDEKVNSLKRGLIRIEDVQLGEQIVTNDGFKTVLMVHHKKEKECVKITLKSGKSIIVSKDHVFPTIDGRKSVNSGLKVNDKLNSL